MARPNKPYYVPDEDRWRTRCKGQWITAKTEEECWRLLERTRFASELDRKERPKVLGQLVRRYKTVSGEPERHLAPLVELHADLPLASIPPSLLRDYARVLSKSFSAWTAQKYFGAARRAIEYGAERGWCTMPLPLKRGALKPGPRSPKGLPVSHVRAIFAELSAYKLRFARRLLAFIGSVGCRPGEAIGLRWIDLDLDAGTVTLPHHKTAEKTGEARTIYLTPAAREIIQESREDVDKGCPWVFPSVRFHKPYTTSGLRAIFRQAAKRAGLKATTYQLRHTFAQLTRRSVPPDVLKVLMGHKDLRTTLGYYRLEQSDACAAAGNLQAPWLAPQDADVPRKTSPASASRPDAPTRKRESAKRRRRA